MQLASSFVWTTVLSQGNYASSLTSMLSTAGAAGFAAAAAGADVEADSVSLPSACVAGGAGSVGFVSSSIAGTGFLSAMAAGAAAVPTVSFVFSSVAAGSCSAFAGAVDAVDTAGFFSAFSAVGAAAFSATAGFFSLAAAVAGADDVAAGSAVDGFWAAATGALDWYLRYVRPFSFVSFTSQPGKDKRGRKYEKR